MSWLMWLIVIFGALAVVWIILVICSLLSWRSDWDGNDEIIKRE